MHDRRDAESAQQGILAQRGGWASGGKTALYVSSSGPANSPGLVRSTTATGIPGPPELIGTKI
jgi:hypothetical protein